MAVSVTGPRAVSELGGPVIPGTLCCGFHHETYIGISPYRSLAVDVAQSMVELCHV